MIKARIALLVLGITSAILGANFSGISALVALEEISVESSKVCKECHVEIYNSWRNALHAMSMDDPIFMASYMESYFESRGESKSICLTCHAPVTRMNNDYDLKNEVTREGVSCDFCHTIKEVFPGRKGNPFEFDKQKTKRGPLSNTSSPAHKTEASSLFKSSTFCAGCHEYINDAGVNVLGTFSEWQNSPYSKEGIECQNCHMPLTEGLTVDSKIKSPSQKKINLHAISAAHSTEQLQKAAKVEIKRIDHDNNFIYVEVDVINIGSGHLIPTGIPTRKLVLWAELRTPNEYVADKRVYQRQLKNKEGKILERIHDILLHAADVVIDTRLKPRETRTERFIFARPKNKKITITARLEYLYVANVMSPTEMRVDMAVHSKEIK
ncbi:MAG: hypothetical protein A2W03_10070 [Candidatus Aminicenantes bacterium RBG_16_63_16]|nr:MAG: hypothetical protein A2W03_10070 [Candidatus Aminicenantes bacterium RBG_16_63_16]